MNMSLENVTELLFIVHSDWVWWCESKLQVLLCFISVRGEIYIGY